MSLTQNGNSYIGSKVLMLLPKCCENGLNHNCQFYTSLECESKQMFFNTDNNATHRINYFNLNIRNVCTVYLLI